MTLSLNHHSELTIEQFSEMTTTSVALQQEGLRPEEQPLARVIGSIGLEEVTLHDVLGLSPDENVVYESVGLVYKGAGSEICVAALSKLAASSSSYHQENAVNILKDQGMYLTAWRSQALSRIRSRHQPKQSQPDMVMAAQTFGSVPLLKRLDYLPPLTAEQERAWERRIAEARDEMDLQNAQPIKAPKERDYDSFDFKTGEVVVPLAAIL